MPSEYVGTLGVMVCRRTGSPPFAEKEYIRQLCLASSKLGLSVYAFIPELQPPSPETSEGFITGYTYRQGRWEKGRFPVPDIIYDRCLLRNAKERTAAGVVLQSLGRRAIVWSRGLPGKARVYSLLKREASLLPHLPHTLAYTGRECLKRALSRFRGELFMKPSGGSHGSHTLYVRASGGTAFVQGRDRDNSMFKLTLPVEELASWIGRFTGGRRFLIQPFLQLTSREGKPFDVRVLVQKNAKGRWMTTGMALRQGPAEGKTSNLHGGGKAVPVLPFLASQFGSPAAAQIMACLQRLSRLVPPLLESGFGRLGELGIDFGVDRDGKVWLLEVNSKPGRRAFRQTGDIPAAKLSVENPLRYARYLLLRQLRRVNT